MSILSTLKGSVGRLSQSTPTSDAIARKYALEIEAIRYDLSHGRFLRRGDAFDREQARLAKEGLLSLATDQEFMSNFGHRPIRFPLPNRLSGVVSSDFLAPSVSISSTLKLLINELSVESPDDLFSSGLLLVEKLRDIVPEQKLAPAQFHIVDSKIKVAQRDASVAGEDLGNVNVAKESLLSQNEKIAKELLSSNCDRRLLETVEEIGAALRADENVITIGLLGVGCEAVCRAFREELPDAIAGLIDGHVVALGMYVSQFPDWRRFSDNAATAELDRGDIEQIANAADAIVAQLEIHPNVADADVPKTIAYLRAFISDPGQTLRKTAFAVLRTIENLVAKIMEYSASLIDKTMTRTIDGVSKAAASTAVVAFMAVALAGATSLTGVTAKISETSWMRTAVEVVQRFLANNSSGAP